MAKTPEKRVKDAAVKLLDRYGAYHFFPATHGYGRSGVPDIVACLNGWFIGIECKAGSNKPTALQVREIERIRQKDGIGLVVNENNLDELGALLRQLSVKGRASAL